MTPPSIKLSGIGQIAINVHDVERATLFYREALGMTHLFTAGDMSFFDCGGIRLMLGLPDRPEFDHPSSIIYFTVKDARGAEAQRSLPRRTARRAQDGYPRTLDGLLRRS